jgi:hypothetical protein
MKKTKVLIIGLACAALILHSCASQKPAAAVSKNAKPKWVDNREAVYPDSQFLSAVGDGDTRSSAESSASANLSRIFESQIKSTFTDTQRYSEISTAKGTAVQNYQSAEAVTQIGSSQTLINVKFTDPYTDPNGRVSVLAYMNRFETANIYRERIDSSSGRAADFIRAAKAVSDPVEKYAYLDAASVLDSGIKYMREQLQIISQPVNRSISLAYEPAELTALKTDAGKQMIFSVKLDGDKDGKVTVLINSILGENGFSSGPNPLITINGEVKIEKLDMANGLENLRWYVNLKVTDRSGKVLTTISQNQRESAKTASQAEAVAYKQIERILNKTFITDLYRYFDNLVKK